MSSISSLKSLSRVLLRARTTKTLNRTLTAQGPSVFVSSTVSSSSTTTRRSFSDKTPPEFTTVRLSITNEEEAHAPKSNDEEVDATQFTVPIEIKMPELGYEHYKGIIETWYKKPGDIIRRDDVLCDITTPDFTFGMSTDDECDAIMGEIVVQAGESAEDHSLICTIWHPKEEGEEKRENGGEKKE